MADTPTVGTTAPTYGLTPLLGAGGAGAFDGTAPGQAQQGDNADALYNGISQSQGAYMNSVLQSLQQQNENAIIMNQIGTLENIDTSRENMAQQIEKDSTKITKDLEGTADNAA